MASIEEPQAGASPAVGERLRERRRELKMTLQEVADTAGFSVGFISQIERGITVPSLTSLVAVCRALKTDVGSFFQSPRVEAPITRREGRQVYAVGGTPDSAVTYERLSASFPGNILRSTLIHEPPGFRSEPMSHEGEEIFFIVEGSLTIEIGGERTILEAGDSAHFPSTMTHVTWNHTTEPATIFHTCTMDVFGDGDLSDQAQPSLVVKRSSTRRSAPKPLKAAKPKTTG